MWIAIVSPLLAIAAGTLLALLGGANPRALLPIRSFALIAVLLSIVTHILPEAVAAGGGWALLVFAVGLVAPTMIGRVWPRTAGRSPRNEHSLLATELGFIGMLLHQVGDGLALGIFTGPSHAGHHHWDVVIGIAAHTVPLAAVLTLSFAARGGVAKAIARAAALAAATLVGVALSSSGSTAWMEAIGPWINALIAGLLVHVLTHDVPSPPRTNWVRTLELVAIISGVALTVAVTVGGHHDDGDASVAVMLSALRDIALVVAPLVALALLGAVLARRAHKLDALDEIIIHKTPWLVAATLVAALIIIACGADTSVLHRFTSPWLSYAACAALTLALARALWRFGLTTWLEPMHGHEHAHEETQPCLASCHVASDHDHHDHDH